MESIFKSLSREYLSVKSVECEKRDLLEEIIDYVDSMEWLSRESMKNKITFFIKSGYDYSKFTEEFDVSYESAKNSISSHITITIKEKPTPQKVFMAELTLS